MLNSAASLALAAGAVAVAAVAASNATPASLQLVPGPAQQVASGNSNLLLFGPGSYTVAKQDSNRTLDAAAAATTTTTTTTATTTTTTTSPTSAKRSSAITSRNNSNNNNNQLQRHQEIPARSLLFGNEEQLTNFSSSRTLFIERAISTDYDRLAFNQLNKRPKQPDGFVSSETWADERRGRQEHATEAAAATQESDDTHYKRRQTFRPKGRHGTTEEKSVSMLKSHLRKGAAATNATDDGSDTMITKSTAGYFVINNITLKSCRDVLKPVGLDRCTLTDYIEDCANDEGLIDYVAFFFCAFSPEKMPIALFVSILWLLILFVATGVTATDFLCPALFVISKTLGLSQNIAGVTFLAFGNTSADIFAGSGTLITTAIVGCVFAIKDFRLDRLIFVRDTVFYVAAVSLLFYIFNGPGRIRLQDSIALLGLYILYVAVVLASKYFTQDPKLKNLHGPSKKDLEEEGGIEFEGVYIDDDPTASMVVMRKFLFYDAEDMLPPMKPAARLSLAPTLKIDKPVSNEDSCNGLSANAADNTLTVATQKSSRRVTLFEDNLFTGANSLSADGPRRSRSASLLSISKGQLNNLRRASRDIRRQSMDFLAAVSPIDVNVWKQRNWGGRTMELVKAPIRLFLLITTPMAYAEHGRTEWNKLLSTLHCITGPIFVVYAFGYGSQWLGPLTVSAWAFIISAPIALLIIFTSTSETPPFYYSAYSSYLGFIVAITWIYTISSEVINLLRALGIAFNLSNEIMGLTILAWGNCMLDFITNVSIARKGLPKMAIAACYGGPLMSTLVGIGLPAFITLLLDPNHNTKLGASPLLYIIFAFLIFGLITSLIIVIALKFNVKRSVGIYLIVLYAIMIIAEWLTEFQIIKLPFLN